MKIREKRVIKMRRQKSERSAMLGSGRSARWVCSDWTRFILGIKSRDFYVRDVAQNNEVYEITIKRVK